MRCRTRSLACEWKKHTSKVTTGSAGIIRRFLRNGFNGFLRALPGDRALLPPSPARCASIVANLASASGRRNHTTSPSASRILRLMMRGASTASRAQRP